MNHQPTLFDVDLSCVKENRVKYSEQDYVRVLNRCGELEKQVKELRQIIKNYNAISRKKKK